MTQEWTFWMFFWPSTSMHFINLPW